MSIRIHGRAWATALALTLAMAESSARAQAVSYVGSLQFTTGDYGLPQTTTSLAFVNGVAVRANRLRGWLSIPVILQNAGWVQYGGAGMVPSGGLPGRSGGGTMGGGGMMGGGDNDAGSASHAGVGDPFGRAEYALVSGDAHQMSLRAVAAAKAPVSRASDGFGTGKWDVGGGLAWSGFFAGSYLFADGTYWALGRPDSLPVENTVSYSVAMGRALGTGRYALLASVSGSTPIIEGTTAPVQSGLGVSYRVSDSRYINGTLSVGLTRTAPTVALGFGWQLGIWR